jgi:Tol biopolymer transport system component
MPYVVGESLRDRLAREGELPVHEAVRLLMEVVDALAEAHRHGVVHRDIKPDNVMLTGRHAMVTDFGVAKAVSEAAGRKTVTTLGVAVGTPAYMSPEQASADPHVDHRSDIYSVGVMAYEMLAGRPPFTGATQQQVLAAHVTEEPDSVAKRRPAIAPALEQVVMKCLAKHPADRWQTADELLARLEPLATPSGGVAPTQAKPVGVAARTRRSPVPIAAAVLLLVAAGSGIALVLSRHESTVTLGQATQVTSDAGLEIFPALSSDGKLVAYSSGTSARARIFVRPVSGGRTIPLTDDTTTIQTQPRWSPDGTTILFLAGGGVFTAPALGGAARPLIPAMASAPVRSAAWSPDGRQVAFTRGDSLFAFTTSGAATRALATGRDLHSCTWSPNGKWLACVSGNWEMVRLVGRYFGNTAASTIVVIPAAGGAASAVTDSTHTNQSPVWSTDSKTLFFVSDRQGPRDIHAQGIASSGHASGEPVRLTTGLNVMSIDLSRDGARLAYAVYTAQSNIWGMPIPSTPPGSASIAKPVTSGSQVIEGIRVSPDRRWLTYDSNLHGNSDLYRVLIAGGVPERLTTDSTNEFQSALSPDGTEVAFYVNRGSVRQIRVLPLNGGPVQVVPFTTTEQRGADWAPDGAALAWYDRARSQMWVARRTRDGEWQAPALRAESFWTPRWSPDGRLLVGSTPDGGVVVVPADSGPVRSLYARRPATADPEAEQPAWSPDGKSIWFKSHDAEGDASLWSLPLSGGAPRLLVRFDDPARPSYRTEWATDGTRIFFAINDRQSDIWVVELSKK